MKNMMTVAMMVIVVMMMVMPVMAATESENIRTAYQEGQIEILNAELKDEFTLSNVDLKCLRDRDGERYMSGEALFLTEHYYIRVYYSKSNQDGYGSIYFRDGTYIASFQNLNEIDVNW